MLHPPFVCCSNTNSDVNARSGFCLLRHCQMKQNLSLSHPPIMNRILILLYLCCLIRSAQGADRPNIVFFFTDDQTTSTLACYGHPQVKTPNIDGLAARGTRFTNAFVSHSICWVSRTVNRWSFHRSRPSSVPIQTEPSGVSARATQLSLRISGTLALLKRGNRSRPGV